MSLLPTLHDYGSFDANTGAPVSGWAHVRQSIRDILTTPKGSRVMRRTYGSDLFSQIDAPMTAGRDAKIVAATAAALKAWEPRVKLTKVEVVSAAAGQFDLNLVLELNGATVRMEGVLQ